jgi:hypothetical protein
VDIWSLLGLLVMIALGWYWLHSRREGQVVMLGEWVESVTFEPYQILE